MNTLISSPEAIIDENAVYYFKKTVHVEELRESVVNIFAESRYKLYINGRLVAVGPCRRSSEIAFYDAVDVTDYLHQGENEIFVAVMQLSAKQRADETLFLISVLRDGSLGLCLWGNAGTTELTTDDTWQVAKERHLSFFFDKPDNFYNAASICERIDSGYRQDLAFCNAVVGKAVYSLDDETGYCSEIEVPLQKRKIPMMYFENKAFENVCGNVYDAGKITCGYVRFSCRGNGTVKLTFAECKVHFENGVMVKYQRDDENGCVIGQYDVIEVDGDCIFEPFWMRTFRYVQVDVQGDVQIDAFDYIETGYPLSLSDTYDFGNEKDNRLFEISANTLRRCMHETYMDCPYYEQLQYTMDTYMQMLFTYQVTTDKRLPEKAIDDFASSYRAGCLTQSRFPAGKTQFITGFSLYFIYMLYDHAQRFEDKAFLRKYLPVVDGVLEWFASRLDGYMVKRSNLWDFMDWCDKFESGQIPDQGPVTVYSMMLAVALKKASQMHRMLGRSYPEYDELAENVLADVKARAYDSEKGLYANSPNKQQYTQHAQIWAVLCGLEEGDEAKLLMQKTMTLDGKCALAYNFHLFRALETAGLYPLVEKTMEDLRKLVDLGCTTTPEWVGDDVRSECHAWSATALYEFTAKTLGVTWSENTVHIEPYIGSRTYAKGEVATPIGMVFCEWRVEQDTFMLTVKLPTDSSANVIMPNGTAMTAGSGTYSTTLR